ncbi:MAG: hypothetical protein PHY07_12385 [Methanosarcina sp.]|nr:hypothetical protein [Methanosarcina sp.]
MDQRMRDIRNEDVFKNFIEVLREKHAIRKEECWETSESVEELLKLSNEEILEIFGDKTSPEFREKILPIVNYINDTKRKEHFEFIKLRAELIVRSDKEIMETAKGIAQYTMRKQKAGSVVEKLGLSLRQYFNRLNPEERIEEQKRTAEILSDLQKIHDGEFKTHKEGELFYLPEETPERKSLDSHVIAAESNRAENVSSRENTRSERPTELCK